MVGYKFLIKNSGLGNDARAWNVEATRVTESEAFYIFAHIYTNEHS